MPLSNAPTRSAVKRGFCHQSRPVALAESEALVLRYGVPDWPVRGVLHRTDLCGQAALSELLRLSVRCVCAMLRAWPTASPHGGRYPDRPVSGSRCPRWRGPVDGGRGWRGDPHQPDRGD